MTTIPSSPENPEDDDLPTQSRGANNNPATQRINLPLNLENWAKLPDHVSEQLLWLHQWLLDTKSTWKDAQDAMSYDKSNVYRMLKGTYAGNWDNVATAIIGFRRICDQRQSITRAEFAENGISKLIWSGLDYAMANNSIVMIVGESRMGKTCAVKVWRERNNHGRSVYVEIPPVGGFRAVLMEICEALGINKNQAADQLRRCIIRALNPNRILLLDEAGRLLNCKNASSLELVRHIHDKTGCAVALISTVRFEQQLKDSTYMFEQILGRIGMPIRLKKEIGKKDVMPILTQYIPEPSPMLLDQIHRLANERGRLGVVIEVLKVASRMASKQNEPMEAAHVLKAMALRKQMSGEN